MILPTKRIPAERTLLYVGAEILHLLYEPATISRLWDELKKTRVHQPNYAPLTYDWFVLAVDLLFTLNVIEIDHGRLRRTPT